MARQGDSSEFAAFFRDHCLRCCIVADEHGVMAKAYRFALNEARATIAEAEGASQWVAHNMPSYQSQVLSALVQRIHAVRRGKSANYVTDVATANGIDEKSMRESLRRKQELAAEWAKLSPDQKSKWIEIAVKRFGESLRRFPNNLEFAAQYTRDEALKTQAEGVTQ